MRIDDEAEREGSAIQRRLNIQRIRPAKKSRGVISPPSDTETARLFKPESKHLDDDLSLEMQVYLRGLRKIRD